MVAQQTPNPNNRRAARRQRIEAPATLWLEQGWQQVICRDISETGAGLTVYRPDLSDLMVLPPKSRKELRVTLQLPEGEVALVGRPVNRGSDRLGLRFGELSGETRAQIDRLMAP